jgi:hypothetical protein
MKNSAAMDDTMMPDIAAGMSAMDTTSDLGYLVAAETPTEAAEAPEAATASPDEDTYSDDEGEDEEGDDWGGSRRKKAGKNKRREQHRPEF